MSATPPIGTRTVAARIPYSNSAPFYALWADAPFAVRKLVPRELGREAEAGSVDLGLMAAGDFLRLEDRFELLAPMGIAARGPVQSVLLFSRRPADALADSLLSVTPDTSTSIRLLKLLLGVRRGLPGVRYVRGLEPAQADGLLLIGDEAMRMRNRPPEGFVHTLDLGADWLDWTGLLVRLRRVGGAPQPGRGRQVGVARVPGGLARGRSRIALRRSPAARPGPAGRATRSRPTCGDSTTDSAPRTSRDSSVTRHCFASTRCSTMPDRFAAAAGAARKVATPAAAHA